MTTAAATLQIVNVGPREFAAYVTHRGYRALPVTNSDAAADGAPLQIVGYELRGPRGNKTFIPKDRKGELSLVAAALWCDGVDYATAKLRRKK